MEKTPEIMNTPEKHRRSRMCFKAACDLLNKLEGDLNTAAETKLNRDTTLSFSLEEWNKVTIIKNLTKVNINYDTKLVRITFKRDYCFRKFEKIENLDTGVLSQLRVYSMEENKNSVLLAWISDTLKENKQALFKDCCKIVEEKPVVTPEKKSA